MLKKPSKYRSWLKKSLHSPNLFPLTFNRAAIVTIAALPYTIQLSGIDQLGIDDLLGLIPAGVHEAYPLHLIGGLQLVRGTGVIGQDRHPLFHFGVCSDLAPQAVM